MVVVGGTYPGGRSYRGFYKVLLVTSSIAVGGYATIGVVLVVAFPPMHHTCIRVNVNSCGTTPRCTTLVPLRDVSGVPPITCCEDYGSVWR
ncbi:hypothetical protein VNO77_01959 [Canavalia gladiata]|uniref:Uncharacterized protein n=1 Tax=Canavalia gladiata TaxID=3824 RepID=A0AAN9R5G6_CANGL